MLDVEDDFLHACFHQAVEFFILHGATVAQRDRFVLVFLLVAVSRGIFAFELFSLRILNLQCAEVAVDVGATERDDGEMAENIVLEDGHGSGFRTHVHEGAS